MPLFIVLNEQNQGQYVEADSGPQALLQVPGGKTVRLALGSEAERYYREKDEQKK